MNKWGYIRVISELGVVHRADTILKLLEWTEKKSTMDVTEDEAREFSELLQLILSQPGAQLSSAEFPPRNALGD